MIFLWWMHRRPPLPYPPLQALPHPHPPAHPHLERLHGLPVVKAELHPQVVAVPGQVVKLIHIHAAVLVGDDVKQVPESGNGTKTC